jgi:hypothetical protein
VRRISRKPLAITAAALLLAACADGPTGASPEATLEQQVAAMGFRADMIEDHGDFVVVEGDIRLTKTQLRAGGVPAGGDPRQPRFQYRTTAVVGSPKVHNVVVSLSELNSYPAWQTAAREAMQHWNGVADSYVRFVEGSPADVSVSDNCDLPANVAAQSSWPSGGNPGPTLKVNPCFAYAVNHSQLVHIMVHELGHNIGFRHTNWTSLGESSAPEGAVHIPYTPIGSDAASVMNGGGSPKSWAGFSYYDKVAIVRTYPLAAPTSVGISYPGGTPSLTWAPVFGAAYYRVRFYQYSSWYSPEYGSNWTHSYTDVGTTSGTSFTDGSRSYTGNASCYIYYPDANEEEYRDHFYSVEAVYANGWAGTLVTAAVATC